MNRSAFPAGGGWKFRQPQIGWNNPMAMVGFDASVNAIISVRKANPAICAKYGLSTDRQKVEAELEQYTRMRLGIPEPSFFRPSSNRLASSVAVAADGIKRAAKGTAVVLDWLTSGGAPVSQELATKRAGICVACPKNVPGSWYTVAPAELIRETLESRSDLKLETPHDENLKSCDICKCLMRLKVWCPMVHILAKTGPEIMREFPEHCWIAKRDEM